ncbi:MAG: hypothetical protein R6U55_17415 [Desulfovermiculus sp.]
MNKWPAQIPPEFKIGRDLGRLGWGSNLAWLSRGLPGEHDV